MIVVANTSPLCYLFLMGHVDLLPILFDSVTIPQVVREELAASDAPAAVQTWIAHSPD